jgi:metal transporter CNNM
MWLTGIISYPLALILDLIFKRCKKDPTALTGDQLGALITSHERSDEHGGKLGKDATRVMLGALNLDGRRIDRVFSNNLEQLPVGDEKDIEKADRFVVHGMVVSWYAVRTIDINEPVNQDFIDKIRSWSYSRIPVVENTESDTWRGIKIFGFLHIKVSLLSGDKSTILFLSFLLQIKGLL